MAYTYIAINESGIATGYSSLSGEVTADNLIPVTAGFDWQNKKWNGTEWEDYEPEPEEEEITETQALAQQLTDLELLILEG